MNLFSFFSFVKLRYTLGPRCSAVYLDFDGCCALTCSCGCKFCAYCETDCGANNGDDDEIVHDHVRSCIAGGGGGLFPPNGHLERVVRQRRQREISEFLLTLEEGVRNDTKVAIAEDLVDHGIVLPSGSRYIAVMYVTITST